MSTNNATNNIEIKVRRMQFDTDAPMNKFSFGGNSLVSTFFYALSALFPDGERFFIHSVRNYQHEIDDPVMLQQIRAFIGQEAHHGMSHEKLNDTIDKMGFPIHKITARLQRRIVFLKKQLGRKQQLALTVAMEHFTASMAEFLLKNPEIFDDVDPTFRNMLIWHAVEEIEHKAVAFDLYRLKVNNEKLRKRVMFISIIGLFSRIAYYQVMCLWAARHFPSLKEWIGATKFFWGKKGILRDNLKSMRMFFQTGFHPWDIDQTHLINDWQDKFPEVASLQINPVN